MKLLSLFDGSGAFPLAAKRHGIIARYASEVEPFPIAVTRRRFPEMEHIGDITKINGAELEPCDLVTCGFPCTDISIAGKGGGLAMARSGLFYDAVRVIREMLDATDGEFPRYILFENVPNLLSINGGADWKIVMDSLTDLGFICDPNILDSQEFGIAQRRKRVFIVGINRKYYDPTDFFGVPDCRHKRMQKAVKSWRGETFCGITSRPHEIRRQHLSEILEHNVDEKYYLSVAACLGILRRVDAKGKSIPQLLRSALEFQAGLSPAPDDSHDVLTFEPGATVRLTSGKHWNGIAPTLRANVSGGDNHPCVVYPVENHAADSRVKIATDGICQTLDARMGMGGGNVPLLAEPVVYGISSVSSNSMNSSNPTSGVYETDTAKTLDTSSQSPKNQGGLVICVQGSLVGRKPENGPAGKGVQEDVSYTLDTHDTPAVAYGIDRSAFNQGANAQYTPQIDVEQSAALVARGPNAVAYSMTTGSFANVCEDKSPTLTARDYKDVSVVAAPPSYIVRRLTPRECLLLMNLPPDWFDNLGIDNPTESDFRFWESVFATLGKKKSRKQIAAFLKKPYSDSACYKMAGNGVVVAVADWIMAGIKEHSAIHNLS